MGGLEIIKVTKELGLSFGVFALCVWIVTYIVKNLAKSLDRLIDKLDVFMHKVKDEHQQGKEQHAKMMEQHEKMIQTLVRLNGKA